MYLGRLVEVKKRNSVLQLRAVNEQENLEHRVVFLPVPERNTVPRKYIGRNISIYKKPKGWNIQLERISSNENENIRPLENITFIRIYASNKIHRTQRIFPFLEYPKL
ncbi:hypothetical protein KY307_03835 [Candidatus Woesearchaeota archaeon]|nr:hypothetical protein [Candidatus Woesearchaeota archaeon]